MHLLHYDMATRLMGVECGGLKENESGTIRKRGLAEVGVALLKEVCHSGGRL